MRHPAFNPFNDQQAGTSLVEVLVAALVLGIGLLGFAMSQARSLDGMRESAVQLQARLLAMEIAEQRRAAGPAGVPAAAVAAWRERVKRRLPAGSARIDWPSPRTDVGLVTLTWSDRSPDRQATLELWFGP